MTECHNDDKPDGHRFAPWPNRPLPRGFLLDNVGKATRLGKMTHDDLLRLVPLFIEVNDTYNPDGHGFVVDATTGEPQTVDQICALLRVSLVTPTARAVEKALDCKLMIRRDDGALGFPAYTAHAPGCYSRDGDGWTMKARRASGRKFRTPKTASEVGVALDPTPKEKERKVSKEEEDESPSSSSSLGDEDRVFEHYEAARDAFGLTRDTRTPALRGLVRGMVAELGVERVMRAINGSEKKLRKKIGKYKADDLAVLFTLKSIAAHPDWYDSEDNGRESGRPWGYIDADARREMSDLD